jgi:hypothetical protein
MYVYTYRSKEDRQFSNKIIPLKGAFSWIKTENVDGWSMKILILHLSKLGWVK